MTRPQTRLLLAIASFLLLCLSLWWSHGFYQRLQASDGGEPRLFRLSDRISTLEVVQDESGQRFFSFESSEGPSVLLHPEVFAEQVQQSQEERLRGGWVFRALDITALTGLFWVGLGLLGQFLFTGRMIVQWLASEKQKRSVVPTAFWWMSLGGSSLLIIYFTWRVDIVGILGQSTGWFIYLRNLWFIYKKP